ncbi:hypothetical protein HYU95_05865 [Candidatus Daviesbacteria bacterium]|nr:hypothetical protein [Candidatus Daviesbacteria bacterium]
MAIKVTFKYRVFLPITSSVSESWAVFQLTKYCFLKHTELMEGLRSFYSNKRNVISLLLFFLLLVSIPIGTYLVSKQQIYKPKAFERKQVEKSVKQLMYYSFNTPCFVFCPTYPAVGGMLDQDKVQNNFNILYNSPYDAFAVSIIDPYVGASEAAKFLPNSVQINQINALRKSKELWPIVYFNRFVGPCNGRRECKAEFANNIGGIDLTADSEDSVQALEEFYQIFDMVLNLAKNIGAKGVVIDPEFYNNYPVDLVYEVAALNQMSKEQVIAELKIIGGSIADRTQQTYPDAILYVLFFNLNNRDSATKYIIEGILETAKQKNYALKVLEGGEITSGYLHVSEEALAEKTQSRRKDFEAHLAQYPNLKLAATLAPYYDFNQTRGWIKQWITNNAANLKVRDINDFKPLFQYLFGEYEYVWFYGAWAAPYDLFNPQEADRYDGAIKDAIAKYRQIPFCGGIAGISCPAGFTCKLDGNYPDAGGVCIQDAFSDIPYTLYYRISDSPFPSNPDESTIPWKQYSQGGTQETISFNNPTPGQDLFIFVQFKDSSGEITTYSQAIKYTGD